MYDLKTFYDNLDDYNSVAEANKEFENILIHAMEHAKIPFEYVTHKDRLRSSTHPWCQGPNPSGWMRILLRRRFPDTKMNTMNMMNMKRRRRSLTTTSETGVKRMAPISLPRSEVGLI